MRDRPDYALHPPGDTPSDGLTIGVQAWDYARQLAFPRLVGRSGERKAAEWIKSQLTDAGYAVEEQSFPIHALPWNWMRMGLAVGFFLLIAAGIAGTEHPLITVLCCAAIPAVFLITDALWKRRNRPDKSPATAGLQSANILARHPAPPQNPVMTVLLTAHYDSKSQSISIRTRIVLIIILLAGILVFGLAHLMAAFYPGAAAWDMMPVMMWTASVFWTASLISILRLLAMRTENRSPGALDNAGSAGVLLALADQFKENPFRSIDIVFAWTGAEEQGLLGAQALAAAWAEKPTAGRTWILNVDGAGIPGALRLVEGGGLLRFPSSAYAGFLCRAAEKAGIPLSPMRLLPGFLLDHIPFSRKGLAATSLITVSEHARFMHTPDDTMDLVDPAGLEEAVRLVQDVLTALDEKPS